VCTPFYESSDKNAMESVARTRDMHAMTSYTYGWLSLSTSWKYNFLVAEKLYLVKLWSKR
jgi:hypothetical protein